MQQRTNLVSVYRQPVHAIYSESESVRTLASCARLRIDSYWSFLRNSDLNASLKSLSPSSEEMLTA